MSELVDFLLARIAEDEAAASTMVPVADGKMQALGNGYYDPDHWTGGVLADPDRVLAECQAKRRILALHDGGTDSRRGRFVIQTACSCGDLPPCRTLAALAMPYADHPDYDDTWRP